MIHSLYIGILLIFSLASAGHALLNKRDSRAGLLWVIICLAIPGAGPLCYWLLGVNRIRSRALGWQRRGRGLHWVDAQHPMEVQPDEMEKMVPRHLRTMVTLSDSVTRRPLVGGNRITPLFNGEQAYPAMLEAIVEAQQSVFLSSYIFDSGRTGKAFAEALASAAARGVDVRVLIDALGECYSLPRVRSLLRKSGINAVLFLPFSLSRRGFYLNLRNHRKLLVVDNALGFTGGMNLDDRHLVESPRGRRPVTDFHFRIEGPVLDHLREAFLEDWHFATGEQRKEKEWPSSRRVGDALCRGVSAGPNEELEKLHWLIIGALNSARKKVRIMTPYFIPDRALIMAINAASLRGVAVEIILPQHNNLPYVHWASQAYHWEILQYGTRIFYQPPPFCHGKLLVVDGRYSLIGSANIDPRSLRLNFEFCVEVYDRKLCRSMVDHFDQTLARSREVHLETLDGRPLVVRLRDSFAKLFSPYI